MLRECKCKITIRCNWLIFALVCLFSEIHVGFSQGDRNTDIMMTLCTDGRFWIYKNSIPITHDEAKKDEDGAKEKEQKKEEEEKEESKEAIEEK